MTLGRGAQLVLAKAWGTTECFHIVHYGVLHQQSMPGCMKLYVLAGAEGMVPGVDCWLRDWDGNVVLGLPLR